MGRKSVVNQAKQRIPYAVITGIMQEIGQQNTLPWRDPYRMTDLARRLALKHGLQPTRQQLGSFQKAYTEATRNAGREGPAVDVDALVRKYAKSGGRDAMVKKLKSLLP
jgi:hypothetical protein